jgi:hypothetical protein
LTQRLNRQATDITTWLRLRSGSVWTAVTMHASHNLFIQGVFDRLTIPGESTEYITTELGAGLAGAYTLIAYWCWKQRASLPGSIPRDEVPQMAAQTA